MLISPSENPALLAPRVLVSLSPSEGGMQHPHHSDTVHAGHFLRG